VGIDSLCPRRASRGRDVLLRSEIFLPYRASKFRGSALAVGAQTVSLTRLRVILAFRKAATYGAKCANLGSEIRVELQSC
jgi:hypothetical protein